MWIICEELEAVAEFRTSGTGLRMYIFVLKDETWVLNINHKAQLYNFQTPE